MPSSTRKVGTLCARSGATPACEQARSDRAWRGCACAAYGRCVSVLDVDESGVEYRPCTLDSPLQYNLPLRSTRRRQASRRPEIGDLDGGATAGDVAECGRRLRGGPRVDRSCRDRVRRRPSAFRRSRGGVGCATQLDQRALTNQSTVAAGKAFETEAMVVETVVDGPSHAQVERIAPRSSRQKHIGRAECAPSRQKSVGGRS